MKKMNGCAVKNGVIELTKAFAKNAYTPGTAEFRYLADLHKAFPDFPIVQRTANVSEDMDEKLTAAELQETITEVSTKKTANGYYYGELGITLFGNDASGYELMIKND